MAKRGIDDDKRKRLVIMWREGYSSSKIATELHATRSMVMGYVCRFGLQRGEIQNKVNKKRKANPGVYGMVAPIPKPSEKSKPAAKIIKRLKKPKPTKIEPIHEYLPSADDVHNPFATNGASLAIWRLRRGQCKFSFGDPKSKDFVFCSDDAVEKGRDSPIYCEHHYALTHNVFPVPSGRGRC